MGTSNVTLSKNGIFYFLCSPPQSVPLSVNVTSTHHYYAPKQSSLAIPLCLLPPYAITSPVGSGSRIYPTCLCLSPDYPIGDKSLKLSVPSFLFCNMALIVVRQAINYDYYSRDYTLV